VNVWATASPVANQKLQRLQCSRDPRQESLFLCFMVVPSLLSRRNIQERGRSSVNAGLLLPRLRRTKPRRFKISLSGRGGRSAGQACAPCNPRRDPGEDRRAFSCRSRA
jgi:hypothetical protein